MVIRKYFIKALKQKHLVKSRMYSAKTMILGLLLYFVTVCECYESEIEARGKKKKIALFVYFADLVLKKFFILKLIYAFVFWVVLHKAGYFLAWFASYLKEQKHAHHEHHEHHEFPQHHEFPHHYEYHDQPYGYGPHRRKNFG